MNSLKNLVLSHDFEKIFKNQSFSSVKMPSSSGQLVLEKSKCFFFLNYTIWQSDCTLIHLDRTRFVNALSPNMIVTKVKELGFVFILEKKKLRYQSDGIWVHKEVIEAELNTCSTTLGGRKIRKDRIPVPRGQITR